MNLAVWIVQGLLGVMFFFAGTFKTFAFAKAHEKMNWVRHVPRALVTFVGVAEMLGGIGLIVPSATGIMPWLSGVAAACLAIIMIGAIGTHVKLKEASLSVAPAILGLLAAFVAWQRL